MRQLQFRLRRFVSAPPTDAAAADPPLGDAVPSSPTGQPEAGGPLVDRLRAGIARAIDDMPTGLIYALAYVTLDWLSFSYEWSRLGLTLWNPPPALTLALLLVRGFRFLPWALAATFIADGIVRGFPAGWLGSVFVAAVIVYGYGLLAWAMRRWARLDLLAVEPRDLTALLLIAPLGVLLIASAHVLLSVALGSLPRDELIEGTLRFWIGDATGVLTTLPLLLLLLSRGSTYREQLRVAWPDFAICLAASAVALGAIFLVEMPASFSNETQYLYLLFPPIVWIAIRRGIFGAAVGIFAIQAGVFASAIGRGLPTADFQLFQLLAVILSSTGLLLGATITSRQNAEAKLRAQREEINRVTQITTFAVMGSALAHELSQPLSSIAAASTTCQLLLAMRDADSAEIVGHLKAIDLEAGRAGRALQRIRNLSTADRAAPRIVDLAAIAAAAVDLVRRAGSGSRISIRIVKGPSMLILADPEQVELAIANVVRNAVEATSAVVHDGTVTVTLRKGDLLGEVVVDDQGPGVSPEFRDRLFEPYASTKPRGLGLGLAITRSLVESQGGRVTHVERRGGGARFVIGLPLANRPTT